MENEWSPVVEILAVHGGSYHLLCQHSYGYQLVAFLLDDVITMIMMMMTIVMMMVVIRVRVVDAAGGF